jgi:hypothetical protein
VKGEQSIPRELLIEFFYNIEGFLPSSFEAGTKLPFTDTNRIMGTLMDFDDQRTYTHTLGEFR